MGVLAPARRLPHDVGSGEGVERSLSREGDGVAAEYHAHGCGRATQSASTLKSQRREQLDLGGSRIVISGEDQARNAAELRSSWLSQVPGRVTVLWSAILFVAPVLAQPTRDQQHWNNALARTWPGQAKLGAGADRAAVSAESEEGERDTRFWRERELEMRAVAARMADAEPKRITLFIVEAYKLLADRAELRKTPKP